MKWDLTTGKKVTTKYKIRPPSNADKKGKGKGKAKKGSSSSSNYEDVKGHTDEVLSLAVSGDEKLLVSAGRDRRVCVWDVETCEWVKAFSGHLGHKDVVSVSLFFLVFKLKADFFFGNIPECCFSQRDEPTLLWFI